MPVDITPLTPPTSHRFLFTTMGSHGDIHPFIALAQHAHSLGHAAAILTNPSYQSLIQSRGIPFFPAGEKLTTREAVQSLPNSMHALWGPLVVLRKMVIPNIEIHTQALESTIRAFSPTLIISHPLCISDAWLCETHNIPHAIATLSPSLWMNPNDTISMSPMRSPYPTRRAVAFDVWIGNKLIAALLDGPLNRIRRSLGLPRKSNIFTSNATGGICNLGLWSPAFRPPLPGDPPTSTICGFPFFDSPPTNNTNLQPLWDFVESGPPPLVFTLGTAVVHARPDFYALAAQACQLLNHRAVLVTNASDYAPQLTPDQSKLIHCLDYAPFSQLFPKAAIAIHHGGIGTTAQALAAGVPSLVVPASHDQFDNAARLIRLGVGSSLHLTKVTPKSLAASLSSILNSPTIATKARQLAASMHNESGPSTAINALINALAKR